jgi:hypothetical protein
MIFAACVAPKGKAAINGRVLSTPEQEVLSVMLWEYAKQEHA